MRSGGLMHRVLYTCHRIRFSGIKCTYVVICNLEREQVTICTKLNGGISLARLRSLVSDKGIVTNPKPQKAGNSPKQYTSDI